MYEQYSPCKRVALVIQFIVLEFSDLFFDWDFYAEVSNTDRFKDQAISKAILVFAIYGTVLFAVEFICLIITVCKGEPTKAEDVIDCLTTWTEDVPQMIMAVYVAVLVQEPITDWVQYSKAILGILESVIRCTIIIVSRYCCRRRNSDDDEDQRLCPNFADKANFFGYFIILVSAAAILIIFAA